MIIAPKKAPLRIHINSHIIRNNRKNKTNYPPITIRYGNGKIAHRYHNIESGGVVDFIYNPKKPMSCGAELWAETHHSITCY